MEENILQLNQNNELTNSKEFVTSKEQNSFLESTFGQVISAAIDMGLRALLPNFLEDGIINVKNTLLREGLTEGIQSLVQEGVNLGKSVAGIFTGKFENIHQMQTAIQKGGLIDSTSNLLDTVLSKVQKNNLLSKNVVTIIKQGKNVLLENVSQNIEKELTNQIKEIEKINTYSRQWKEYFDQKDFNNMDKTYKKLERSLDKVIPLEQTIKQAREIENIHQLIKNNGKNFEITEIEKSLAKKLA